MGEKIIKRSAKEMYIEDMVKYSIIVDRRRAFPEIRDGLKPVQRKVIYDMFEQGAISYNKRKKSAKITGDTMGKYHAHGDSSIYTAMQTLATWFKCKMPLIAPHGNWGTVMGDGAAAQRYTEAGLSNFCFDCVIGDLKEAQYCVDWQDNFDLTEKMPEFLPVKIPLLLVNGSFGIGVGMATNIPPHNLSDVIAATRTLIRNKDANIVLVPDHCQPLKIIDTDFKKISETGTGSYKVRGIIETGEEKGYPVIYIKSLPDNVSTDSVKEKILALIEKKQLLNVKDFFDSSKQTVNMKLILKKQTDPSFVTYVKEMLYTKCGVQATVSVNFEVVDGVNPRLMNYKEYLLHFLNYRATTKFRIYCNKYKDVSTRLHKLDAYIKVISSGEIDNIIKMVKKQDITDEATLVEYLLKKVEGITDIQAKYILQTNVMQLSKGYLKKYKEEYAKLYEFQQDIYKKIIDKNGTIIMNEIDQELEAIDKKYGKPRICKVVKISDDNNIPKGTFKVVITERNYLKKIPDTDKVGVTKGDNPKFILRVDNTENLLLFDNKGKVFKMPVFKIPVTDKNGAGIDVRILQKNLTANIIAAYYEPDIKKVVEGKRKHFLTVLTRDNIIKKLEMEDFINVNLSGLMYSKLKDDDVVVGISIVPADLDVVVYSKQKALRMHLTDIPLLKRNASGNKAMNTNEYIEGISVVYPDTQYIMVITANGKMNKLPINSFIVHGRAKAGNNVIKLDSTDNILEVVGVSDGDYIRATCADGIFDVPVADVKVKSGIAAGQKMIATKTGVVKVDIIYNVK